MPRKFFSLKNMLKIDTFLLVANFFSGKIYRGSFTNQNGFSALLKKITEIRNFWIGCMNYIYGKTFFAFYENFEILSSRPLFLGKFDFFWKNQKTTFLLKKIFFSSMRCSRGIRRCPRWRIFFFHLPIGWECMKRLTHVNLASKKIFYLISLYGPVSGPKTPWMCQKSFFSYFPPY